MTSTICNLEKTAKLLPGAPVLKLLVVVIGLLGVAVPALSFAAPLEPVDCVDPFIGTLGDGDVYPEATLPFGFIQVSPDTGPASGSSGYKFNKNITGMAGPLYGELSVFPLTGELKNPSALAATGKSAEAASPGYYTVTLAPWDVKVELTSTKHPALHRHTFPAADTARVAVDAGHCLFGTDISWQSAKLNGRPWNQAWLRHADIIDGGTLDLVMTAMPSSWGSTHRPPSISVPALTTKKYRSIFI